MHWMLSNEIPGTGNVNRADPPPEIKTITKSLDVRAGNWLSINFVELTDAAVGIG